MEAARTAGSLRTASLIREVGRLYRTLFPSLLVAALVVYVPISLVDAIVEPLSEVHAEAGVFEVVKVVAIVAGLALLSLLGEVIYAAIVASLVTRHRGTHHHSLPGVLRSLPYARLAVADVTYALLVGLGMLLIVPGFVFLAWFVLVAPAIHLEDRGVVSALRRSRALVRPHFWKILSLIVPLTFLSDLISVLVSDWAVTALRETFVGDWIGAVLGEVVTAPFLALFVVLAFLELRASYERQTAAR